MEHIVIDANLKIIGLYPTSSAFADWRINNVLSCEGNTRNNWVEMAAEKFLEYNNTHIEVKGHIHFIP